MAKDSTKPNLRQARASQNREALIEATLSSIAESGIAQTSVSMIVERAGLSRGMIQLHFGGKENLLVEAVRHAGETYYAHLNRFLDAAGSAPEDRITALIRCDLDEAVLNRRSINIWYAFRGEARENSPIASLTNTRDERLNAIIFRAFMEIATAQAVDDPAQVARDATHGTLALLEGMWTDFLLHPGAFDRAVAKRIVFRFLAALFPGHFRFIDDQQQDHPQRWAKT